MATATVAPGWRGVRLPGGVPARLGVLAAAAVGLYAAFHGTGAWPAGWTTGIQGELDRVNTWVANNNASNPVFVYGFNYLGTALSAFVNAVYSLLAGLTWVGLTVLAGAVALRWATPRVALLMVASFLAYGVLGLWQLTLVTLALILASVLLALAIGVPLGIAAGLSDRVSRLLTPVLDVMQVMPAFAYLMPVVLLFGIGAAAGVVVTVVFALPPAVRITALGIRGVAASPVEAGRSLGATPRQLLTKVQLPLARQTIMVGVNQVIMLALSMVVIASLIAAGGLGDPVLKALTVVKVGNALVPGVAIVLVAVSLDRLTLALAAPAGRRRRVPPSWLGGWRPGPVGSASGRAPGPPPSPTRSTPGPPACSPR